MYTTLLRPLSKGVRRHPRKALALGLFALKHQQRLRAMNRAGERAARSATTARRVAANPKVHKELRLALAAVALASERAREVGVVRASRDRRVAGHLQHAGQHASKAITIAERVSRRRRSVRKVATITLGAGALGGAAYAGWKIYGGRPPASTVPPAFAQPAEQVEEPSGAGEA